VWGVGNYYDGLVLADGVDDEFVAFVCPTDSPYQEGLTLANGGTFK
jgi:hypothetical protein